jgi:hypothetical protein
MQQTSRALTPFQDFEQDLELYRKHYAPNCPPDEWLIFLKKCYHWGLNPLRDEIHIVGRQSKRGDKFVTVWTAQVSITGLIRKAEETGRYRGHTEAQYYDKDGNLSPIWLTKNGPHPYGCRVGIRKEGYPEPAYYSVAFAERAQYRDRERTQLINQWATQGAWMLFKCTLAAALRWEFQEACGGLYIAEEMNNADLDAARIIVIPEESEQADEAMQHTIQMAKVPRPIQKQRPSRAALVKSADQYVPGGWPAIEKALVESSQPVELLADYDSFGIIPEEYFEDEKLIDQAAALIRKLAKKPDQQATTPDQLAKLVELKALAKRIPGGWPEVVDQLVVTSSTLSALKKKNGYLREDILLSHLGDLEKIVTRLLTKAEPEVPVEARPSATGDMQVSE